METPQRFRLVDRLRAEAPLKLVLTALLPVIFCAFYFGVQRLALFPVRSVPRTWLDERVPFDPAWVWAYQSIYLLMPILPWLALRRDDLVSYARGWALLCGSCFAIFIVAPVPGPSQPEDDHAGYRFLVSYVGTLNAFPSLHAGLSAYTFLFGYELLRPEMSRPVRAAYLVAAVAWTGLILYGTLATKMHWVVDLPAGIFAAWICHAWAWRSTARRRAPELIAPGTHEPQW